MKTKILALGLILAQVVLATAARAEDVKNASGTVERPTIRSERTKNTMLVIVSTDEKAKYFMYMDVIPGKLTFHRCERDRVILQNVAVGDLTTITDSSNCQEVTSLVKSKDLANYIQDKSERQMDLVYASAVVAAAAGTLTVKINSMGGRIAFMGDAIARHSHPFAGRFLDQVQRINRIYGNSNRTLAKLGVSGVIALGATIYGSIQLYNNMDLTNRETAKDIQKATAAFATIYTSDFDGLMFDLKQAGELSQKYN